MLMLNAQMDPGAIPALGIDIGVQCWALHFCVLFGLDYRSRNCRLVRIAAPGYSN